MLSNILLSKLSPYIDEVDEDHEYGVWGNRSTADQIFRIFQILEKKWEYNETVHQLFINFKKAYDSVRRELLYNILNTYEICERIEMYSSKTYVKVLKGKHLSNNFLTQDNVI
jgi:hypothetical protein